LPDRRIAVAIGIGSGIGSIFKAPFGRKRLRIPRILKKAIGGFAVGIIGMFLPQVLGTGNG